MNPLKSLTALIQPLVCLPALAQEKPPLDDWKPAPSNIGGQPYQRLNSERRASRPHITNPPGTAHEWQTWRRSLREFAPLLFQN